MSLPRSDVLRGRLVMVQVDQRPRMDLRSGRAR